MFFPKEEERHFFCHKCKNEIEFEVKMQRTDTCPHCGADLHVCMNCEYWDPGEPNQCREHITEYIADRERTNYCTFFKFKSGEPEPAADKDAIKAKLDSLFNLPKK